MSHDEPVRHSRQIVRVLDRDLSDLQRSAVATWAQRLIEIRSSEIPARRKAQLALRVTRDAHIIFPIVRSLAGTMTDAIWKDRSWSARLGLGAAAVAAATLGGEGAGIAALGGAIGLPLWIVLGAGGAFAGMLVDELQHSPPASERSDPVPDGGSAPEDPVPEAEWTFHAALDANAPGLLEVPDNSPGEEMPSPRWRALGLKLSRFRGQKDAESEARREDPEAPSISLPDRLD